MEGRHGRHTGADRAEGATNVDLTITDGTTIRSDPQAAETKEMGYAQADEVTMLAVVSETRKVRAAGTKP